MPLDWACNSKNHSPFRRQHFRNSLQKRSSTQKKGDCPADPFPPDPAVFSNLILSDWPKARHEIQLHRKVQRLQDDDIGHYSAPNVTVAAISSPYLAEPSPAGDDKMRSHPC